MSIKEKMLLLDEKIQKAVNKYLNGYGKTLIVSHYDADGIASSALLQKTLITIKKEFDYVFIKILGREIIENIAKTPYKNIIFSDLGSGNIEDIEALLKNKTVLILDHHQLKSKKQTSNVVQINPFDFGFDGEKDISGAGITYLFCKKITPRIKEYAYLSIVGAFGDSQMENNEIGVINKHLLEESLMTNKLKKSKGLNIFGKFTRPLHKSLEFNTDPYIEGITGNESGAVQFLISLGIPLNNGKKWRTLSELSKSEEQKLTTALLLEVDKKEYSKIVGDVYRVLDNYEIKEFVTLLNACGRMEKPFEGIKLCLGINNNSERIYEEYHQELSKSMSWIKRNQNKFIKEDDLMIIDLKNEVNPNLTGTVLSMIIKNQSNYNYFISMATEKDMIKISARTGQKNKKNVNLNYILQKICANNGGYGGGHKNAAGGRIPLENKDKFIKDILSYFKSL